MLESKAKQFAITAHKGQTYGTREYTFHLEAVVAVAKKYKLNETIVSACWLHDTIEDCKVSFQDIKSLCGENVAEIVFCVTDELGRNRKERKEKTYPKLAGNQDAICVKLCDRIANIQQTISDRNTELFSMYLKEHKEFREKLFKDHSKDPLPKLWSELEELIQQFDTSIIR
jgi:(p)ppGpp synthase/HD superfamily hydrolase